jgi:hypothetical protein
MEMTEIKRTPIGIVEDCSSALADLAESAKNVLGYSLLAQLTAKPKREPGLTKLQQALKDLDIEVLNIQDVERYKRERQIEETVKQFKAWMSAPIERNFEGPGWYREKIESYSEPVPEFVLAKAVQIKTAFPDCVISIESLRTHPDPFLTVEIPHPQYSWNDPLELYYVEVWAEPKFEGRVSRHIPDDDIPW